MKSGLDIEAEIFGSSSRAAISFRDQKDATAILSGMKVDQSITKAVIYSGTGKTFAQYTRDRKPGDAFISPQIHADGSWFQGIRLDDQTIGVIYVESDLDALHSRFTRFATIATGILLLSSLLALILSARLQRIISRPVAHLAATARAICRLKDYSGRAVKESDDELGQLIDTFNEMLAEIEFRDGELL